MRLGLILLTIADLALALLLLAVSGFVLQGVNNTGPLMPDALWFALMLIGSFAAPIVAWIYRARFEPALVLTIAAAPVVAGVGIVMFG